MKNSTELHELDIKIATELFGWELIDISYFGFDDSPRQQELEGWIDDVGITDIGEYLIDIENNYWILSDDWNPTVDEKQAIMILRWFSINDLHWTLNNVIPGSDSPVYELRIQDKNIYSCEFEISLAICMAAKQMF